MNHTRLVLWTLTLLTSSALAKDGWTVGGKIGMKQEGKALVPSVAVTAEYAMGNFLSWRTDLEARIQDVAGEALTSFTVPTQLLVHPVGRKGLVDPYVGPGLSVSRDAAGKFGAGAHGLAGISIQPTKGKSFGVEARWGWPDLVHSANTSFDMALTGTWEVKF